MVVWHTRFWRSPRTLCIMYISYYTKSTQYTMYSIYIWYCTNCSFYNYRFVAYNYDSCKKRVREHCRSTMLIKGQLKVALCFTQTIGDPIIVHLELMTLNRWTFSDLWTHVDPGLTVTHYCVQIARIQMFVVWEY